MKLFLIRLLSLLPFQQKDTWAIIPNPELDGSFLAVRNKDFEQVAGTTLGYQPGKRKEP